MNDNEDKIYDLIISKSFEELSKDEQAFVLEHLGSQEAYTKTRETNLAAMEMMAEDEEVPAELKSSVMSAYDEEFRKKTGIMWWKYAAAVALLIIGGYIFWPAGNPENVQLAENKELKKEMTEGQEEEITQITDEDQSAKASQEERKNERDVSTTDSVKALVEERSANKSADEKSEVGIAMDNADSYESPTNDEDMEVLSNEMTEADLAEDEAASYANELSELSSEEMVVPENFNSENAGREQITSVDAAPSKAQSTLSMAGAQNVGVLLSTIGGPFPKAYVAY